MAEFMRRTVLLQRADCHILATLLVTEFATLPNTRNIACHGVRHLSQKIMAPVQRISIALTAAPNGGNRRSGHQRIVQKALAR